MQACRANRQIIVKWANHDRTVALSVCARVRAYVMYAHTNEDVASASPPSSPPPLASPTPRPRMMNDFIEFSCIHAHACSCAVVRCARNARGCGAHGPPAMVGVFLFLACLRNYTISCIDLISARRRRRSMREMWREPCPASRMLCTAHRISLTTRTPPPHARLAHVGRKTRLTQISALDLCAASSSYSWPSSRLLSGGGGDDDIMHM